MARDGDAGRPQKCNSLYAKIRVEDDKGEKIAGVWCKEIAMSAAVVVTVKTDATAAPVHFRDGATAWR